MYYKNFAIALYFLIEVFVSNYFKLERNFSYPWFGGKWFVKKLKLS